MTEKLLKDYGFTFQFFLVTSAYIVYIALSKHWFFTALMLFKEIAWVWVLLCLMLLCLCFPFIQPFITPQLPDLSCEPHWQSWCTDLSWVRCEIWIGCMCEYGCEFDVSVYCTCVALFSFCTLPLILIPAYVLSFWLTYTYCIFYIVFVLELIFHYYFIHQAFFNLISFKRSGILLFNKFFSHHHHLRRSQSLMNCWLGILVTKQPSAQWLPLNHADANFTVQSGCASLCHHPGGRVLGMLGRGTPPACASSAVSLVGPTLKINQKTRSLPVFSVK